MPLFSLPSTAARGTHHKQPAVVGDHGNSACSANVSEPSALQASSAKQGALSTKEAMPASFDMPALRYWPCILLPDAGAAVWLLCNEELGQPSKAKLLKIRADGFCDEMACY